MSWLSHWFHELLIGGRRRQTAVRGRLSRNRLCPCGSGKKYKRCCLSSDAEEESKRLSEQYSAANRDPPVTGGASAAERGFSRWNLLQRKKP
jgi:hypothetical protein